MTIAKDFAHRLTQAREGAGLSKAELADAAGVNRSGMSHFESGRHLPGIESLAAICTVLEVTTDSLLGIDPKGQHKGRHAKLFATIETLDSDGLALVRQFVHMLAKRRQRK